MKKLVKIVILIILVISIYQLFTIKTETKQGEANYICRGKIIKICTGNEIID